MGSSARTGRIRKFNLQTSIITGAFNMKITLIITLTAAALMANASPLDPDNTLLTKEVGRTRRSINGCPYQVTVTNNNYETGPYKILRHFFGTYTIQVGTVNGRDWYKKDDDVISWVGDAWWVQSKSSLGKAAGWMYAKEDRKCPHQAGYDWLYYAKSLEEWLSAGRKMTVKKST